MITERERARAARRVDDFQRRYGEAIAQLACHAALPVVLDATLVHLLRINFFAGASPTMPFTAEVDLLLGLCDEISDGLYEIDPAVREVLLVRLAGELGGRRVCEVALLLFRYSEQGAPWGARSRLERAQQLTALSFLDPQKSQDWLERVERDTAMYPEEEQAWFTAMRHEIRVPVTIALSDAVLTMLDALALNKARHEIELTAAQLGVSTREIDFTLTPRGVWAQIIGSVALNEVDRLDAYLRRNMPALSRTAKAAAAIRQVMESARSPKGRQALAEEAYELLRRERTQATRAAAPFLNPDASRSLSGVLPTVFPTTRDLLEVLDSSGIDAAYINFNQPYRRVWRDIIDRASRNGSLPDLLDVIGRFALKNEDLSRALEALRRDAGARPSLKSLGPDDRVPWVRVAGSSETPLAPDIERVAESVGAALAREGYGLITSDFPGVDLIVARAFSRALDPSIPLASRLLHVIPRAHVRTFPGATVDAESDFNYLDRSVELADAVVLIAGGQGTNAVADLARQREKPTLAFGATGGVAAQYSIDTLASWPPEGLYGLSFQDYRRLDAEGEAGVVALMDLLHRVVSEESARERAEEGDAKQASTSEAQMAEAGVVRLKDLMPKDAGTTTPSGPVDVVVVYAAEDRALVEELLKHVERTRTSIRWHMIGLRSHQSSQDLPDVVMHARVILLFLTADFLVMYGVFEDQIDRVLERGHKGEATIIPILARDCLWRRSRVRLFAVVPKDATPIWSRTGMSRTKALLDVGAIIQDAVAVDRRRYNRALPWNKADFLILTSLKKESNAFLSLFHNRHDLEDVRGVSCLGSVITSGHRVVDVVTASLGESGPTGAALGTTALVERWRPRHIIVAGVAGGVQSVVNLGDVLLAQRIADYTAGKQTDRARKPRWSIYDSDRDVMMLAKSIKDDEWLHRIHRPRPSRRAPKVHFGTIVSGGDVIASTQLVEEYRQRWSDLIGVDMEGAGVAAALSRSSKTPFTVIRGVADFADATSSNSRKWKEYACFTAAAFTVELITRYAQSGSRATGKAGSAL